MPRRTAPLLGAIRHLWTRLLLATLLVAPAAFAGTDPWIVPGPGGAELLLVMEKSERSYSLNAGETPWKDANGPERVELSLTKEEKDGLASARALVAKGDHDGASKALDTLLAQNAANWDANFLRAVSLHARGAPADAVAPLRESLIGNRRNPEAWKLLEDVAQSLGKKVVRPQLDLRGWVREPAQGEIEVGSVFVEDTDMPWTYYAAARAVYRHEGAFARDFPDVKTYAFTFREQMYAMRVLADAAEEQRKDGEKNPPELERLLAERKAGTLAPFVFFAAYPEPLPRTPEAHIDELRPQLAAYFDGKVLIK